MSEKEDGTRELVQRAGSGDREAFGRLYEKYWQKVYGLCLRMLKDSSEAEDLAQEVWMKLMGRIASFKGDSLFSTWLHIVTVREVLMYIRARNTRSCVNVSYGEAPIEEMLPSSLSYNPDPVTRISLSRAMRELAPGYRTVLSLISEGYEHKEIAGILNISEGTSKSQLSKGRHSLKKAMGYIES